MVSGYFERSTASLKAQKYFLQKKKGARSAPAAKAAAPQTVKEKKNSTATTERAPLISKNKHHILQNGETLKSVAKTYKVPVTHLEKLNARKIKKGLKVGDKIQIS